MLLANLAEAAPVLILLDDVHFADASSWDALSIIGPTSTPLGGSRPCGPSTPPWVPLPTRPGGPP